MLNVSERGIFLPSRNKRYAPQQAGWGENTGRQGDGWQELLGAMHANSRTYGNTFWFRMTQDKRYGTQIDYDL